MATNDPLASEELARVVGRRSRPPQGCPPSPEARAAMSANARYLTRVPKGIFLYRRHEQANADREKWLLDAMAAARHA